VLAKLGRRPSMSGEAARMASATRPTARAGRIGLRSFFALLRQQPPLVRATNKLAYGTAIRRLSLRREQ
jgi:hypothetical protein